MRTEHVPISGLSASRGKLCPPTDCFPSTLLQSHTQAKGAGLRHSPNRQQTHFQFDKMSVFSSHGGLYFLDTSSLLTHPFHHGLITVLRIEKITGEFGEASVFLNMSTSALEAQFPCRLSLVIFLVSKD